MFVLFVLIRRPPRGGASAGESGTGESVAGESGASEGRAGEGGPRSSCFLSSSGGQLMARDAALASGLEPLVAPVEALPHAAPSRADGGEGGRR